MKRKVLSLLLTFCMALSLMPVQAFAAPAQPDVHPAILHDTTADNPIADDALYKKDSYEAKVSGSGDGTVNNPFTVSVSVTDLQEHQNGDSPESRGYWVGFAVAAPDGALGMKVMAQRTQISDGDFATKANGSKLDANVIKESESNYKDGLAVYADANKTDPLYVAYQWTKDEQGTEPLADSEVTYIEMDLSGVKKYQAPAPAEEVTVTFKVVGGTFTDVLDTDNTTKTVQVIKGEALKDNQIPKAEVMKANEGFKATGKWDTEPNTTAKIENDTIYTYTFEEKTTLADFNKAVEFTEKESTAVTVDLSAELTGVTKAKATLTDGNSLVQTVTLADNTLTVTPVADLTADKFGDVTVTITSDSHKDATLTLNVTVKAAAPAPDKKTPTIEGTKAITVTYGDAVSASVLNGKDDVLKAVVDGQKVAGSFEWMDVTSYGDAATDAKTLKAKFVPEDGNTYNTVEDIEVTVTVNKATYTDPIAKAVEIPVNSTKEIQVDLSDDLTSIAGAAIKSVTPDTNDLVTSHSVDGLVIKIVPKKVEAKDQPATLTATVSSTNYNDFNVTLNLKTVEASKPDAKKDLTVSTPLTASPITYGQTLSSSKFSGGQVVIKGSTTPVEGTWAWTNGKIYPNAGTTSYEATFTPKEADKYNPLRNSITVTVNKATPTGTASYNSIYYYGQTLNDAYLNQGTINVSGRMYWLDMNNNYLADTTIVEPNVTYKWVFQPGDTNNYNYLTGTVILFSSYYPPYYPPYNPNVPGGNGTVVNPDGSTTTTVVKPDGTRVETTLAPNGTKTEVQTSLNGTVQTIETRRDGTQVSTTSDAYGTTTANVYVPYNVGETVVTVPTQRAVTSGTVAVIVSSNGAETIVKDSVITDKGVALPVEGRVTVKLRDNTKFFADVQSAGHWASSAIEFVTSREIFNGTGAGRFEPNAGMTRGMLAVALYNLENAPAMTHMGSFGDVAGNAWYRDAVLWAADQGIVSGYGNGTFGPNDKITREQLAVMLYRYAKNPYVSYSSMYFNDAGQIGGYAEDAVRWAVSNGILTGKPGNMLDPKGEATRAEVATMLQRFLNATVK